MDRYLFCVIDTAFIGFVEFTEKRIDILSVHHYVFISCIIFICQCVWNLHTYTLVLYVQINIQWWLNKGPKGLNGHLSMMYFVLLQGPTWLLVY